MWMLVAAIAPVAIADGSAAELCAYQNVFVDSLRQSPHPIPASAERARLELLGATASAVSEFGLRVIADRSEAWWTLSASALSSGDINVGLSPQLELRYHLFMAQLEREDLDVSSEAVGGLIVFSVDLAQFDAAWKTREGSWRKAARDGLAKHWTRTAPIVTALCAMEQELQEEGWDGIEELRAELVEEMRRVRRARGAESQRRVLEIKPEDPDV
jgi:hypothetical protein